MTLAASLSSRPDRCPHGFAKVQHGKPHGCPCPGLAAKAAGQARADAATPDDVKRRIDLAIRRWATTGQEFSANDVRPEFEGVSGGIIGSRFTAASRAGVITFTGNRVPSTLTSTHAHEIKCWRGAA